MSRISEERKEILLRRYGNINTAAGSGAMEPGRGKMSGGFGGPGGEKTAWIGGPRGMRGAVGGAKPKNASATINRLLAYIGRTRLKFCLFLRVYWAAAWQALPEAIFYVLS